jgi:DNA-binding NtrC family response regulator
MAGRLGGRRVLVVEDDWFLADITSQSLEDAGATVIGPASDIPTALALLDDTSVDLAVLDFDLKGKPALPLIEELLERGVKVAVITGYGQYVMPLPVAEKILIFQKPVWMSKVIEAISRL